MSDEPVWIHPVALKHLHGEGLAHFGGLEGIRDEGLFESVMAGPRDLFAYEKDVSLAALAAAYCYRLAKNHSFVDGNKRVAFLSVGLFLGLNGMKLNADQVDAIQVVLGVASGQVSEQDLAIWIEENPEELGGGNT